MGKSSGDMFLISRSRATHVTRGLAVVFSLHVRLMMILVLSKDLITCVI